MTKKKQLPGRIRVGIGGWTYEPWRGSFYPPGLTHKRELEYASGKLGAIEINGTYYGSQKPESFERWYAETPADFTFTLKGPRFTTNRRVLAEAGDSVERFFASGPTRLGEKLGPINWQFAPGKRFDAEDFAAFLALLPREVDGITLRHAVELRHESFADPRCAEIASQHGVAIVQAGDSEYPQIDAATAPFVYARIMGTREDEPLGYAPAELDRWAARAREWAADGRDVFLFVISGFKERNPTAAMALQERLAE